jgi:hypothetical protein
MTKKKLAELAMEIIKSSKRLNSNITIVSNKECKNHNGGDFYFIYAGEGHEKKELLRSFKEAIK